MTESQLQDRIRLALGNVPGLVLWRNNCGTAEIRGYPVKFGVANPGGADLIGIWNGRFVAVEIKTPTGRVSPDQIRFAELVRSKGGEYVILRSVDEARAWVASHV